MIIVNCALMQDKIIKIVEDIEKYKFKYVKTKGIRIYFQTDAKDLNEVARYVKGVIKATPIGTALYLNVTPA